MKLCFLALIAELSGTTCGDGRPMAFVAANIEDTETRKIFYQMWNFYGDEWFSEHLKREGYEPLKKSQVSPVPD